jgi:hypothetical protein
MQGKQKLRHTKVLGGWKSSNQFRDEVADGKKLLKWAFGKQVFQDVSHGAFAASERAVVFCRVRFTYCTDVSVTITVIIIRV